MRIGKGFLFLVLWILYWSPSLGAAPTFGAIPEDNSEPVAVSSAKPGEDIFATVRILRGSPQTEVFFMDRKDSLAIPAGAEHNRIFEACLESSRKRTPVGLRIDPKTRTILSVQPGKSGLVPSSSSGDSQTDSSSGSN